MSNLSIIVNDITLDLFEGSEDQFYVTEQIHDLYSLQTRNASFARTLDVPGTDKNKQALQGSIPVLNGELKSIEKLPCSILMKGVSYVTNAEVSGGVKTDNTYSLTFYYANYDFFERIRGRFINELDFGDLDFLFDGNGYLSKSQETKDLVCALMQWFDSTNLTNEVASASVTREQQDLNFSGFQLYLKSIARRIVEQNGFTFNDDAMLPLTNYETLVLCCPVKKFSDLTDIANPIYAFVQNTNPQLATGEAQGTEDRIIFDITTGDPAGIWDTVNNEWQFTGTNNLNITLSVSGQEVQEGGQQDNRIRIYKNNNIIIEWPIRVSSFDFDLIVNTSVINGDIIYATVFIARNADITLDANNTFTISEEGANFDRNIIVSEWIPPMLQSKFLESLAGIFNAVIDTNEVTKEVKLIPYDAIFTSDQQDLTPYFDTGKEVKEVYSIPYNKRNVFKYAESDSRRTDTPGVWTFPDELLNDTGVIIELQFTDADNSNFISSIYTNKTVPVLENPSYNVEQEEKDQDSRVTTTAPNTFNIVDFGGGTAPDIGFKVGDYIELTVTAPSGSREVNRISQKTTATTGTCFNNWSNIVTNQTFILYRFNSLDMVTPRIGNIINSQGLYYVFYDGNQTVTGIGAGFEVRFTDDMVFNQLIEEHYKNLLTSLSTPLIIQAWFKFTPMQLLNISLSKRVYLQNYNAMFIINKIEQYKVNGFCRVELVRI